MLGTDRVSVCFFGEGALGQGLLYEVMNMAALWKLPVVYVCENNLYNEYTNYDEVTAGSIPARAEAFGIPAEEVDGQDVVAVLRGGRARRRASARRRGAVVPALRDLPLPRPPRRRRRPRLLPLEGGGGAVGDRARPDRPAGRTARRRRGARRAPTARSRRRWRPPSSMRSTAPYPGSRRGDRGCLRLAPVATVGTRELTFSQAVNEALAEELRRDPTVFLIGEDVAEAGTRSRSSPGWSRSSGPSGSSTRRSPRPGSRGSGSARR